MVTRDLVQVDLSYQDGSIYMYTLLESRVHNFETPQKKHPKSS